MTDHPATDQEDMPLASVEWFNDAHDGAGWYYWDDEYRDEGSVGAFLTRKEAEDHAKEGGYRIEEIADV
jgi:hypothetical protein